MEKNITHVFKKEKGLETPVERVLFEFGTERKIMKIIVFESVEAWNGMELNDLWYLAQ